MSRELYDSDHLGSFYENEQMTTPRDMMMKLRREKFSDSMLQDEYTITRSELEYLFSILSTKNQEKDFENFATELCKRLICPNIVPATGPYGGGDGKVDASNYIVSSELALYWGIEEGQDSSHEPWAFAYSTKKDWKNKCKHDIDSILGTQRNFKRICFVTSQFAKSKDRAEIFDKYKDRIRIDIFDLNWILSEVTTRKYYDIIEYYLQIDCRKNDNYLLGVNDYKRKQELEELEKDLENNKTDVSLLYKNAKDSLRIANLYSQLDRPFQETKMKFNIAKKLAEKVKSSTLLKNVYYDMAWKYLYWYENYDEFFIALAKYKNLIINTHLYWDIERYSNLINSIFPSISLTEYKDKANAEIEQYISYINDIDMSKETKLFDVEVNVLLALNMHLFKKVPIDETVKILNELFEKGKRLIGFDVITLKRCLEVFAQFIEDDDFLNFYNNVISYCGEYLAGVAKANNYIDSAIICVKREKNYEAISLLGKACVLFIKEDSLNDLALCFCKISILYEKMNMYWAARSSILNGLYYISKEVQKVGDYDTIFARAVLRLAKIELELGRLNPFCNTMLMANLIIEKLELSGYKIQDIQDILMQTEGLLCRLIFKVPFNEYEKLQPYYDIFDSLDLVLPTMLIEYLFEDPRSILANLQVQDLKNEKVTEYIESMNTKLFPDFDGSIIWTNAEVKLSSNILGCKFVFILNKEPEQIKLAEAILSSLEGFFVTFKRGTFATAISNILLRITTIAGEDVIVDFVDGLSKKIQIGIPSWEIVKLKPDLLGELILNITLKIVENGFLTFLDNEVFKDITKSDAIMERINYLCNPFVDDNFFGWDIFSLDFIKIKKRNKIKLLRKEMWIPKENVIDTFEYEIEKSNAILNTYNIINIPLWDKAKWSGTMFGYLPNCQKPPLLGFVYSNICEGERIFSQWIEEIGEIDNKDIIKISIIMGVSNSNPYAYKVAVSYNENLIGEKKLFVCPTRFNIMDAKSSQHLDAFIKNYNITKSYFIAPCWYKDGKPIIGNKMILLHKLNIVQAWEIGLHSILRNVILPDDDIIIPENKVGKAPIEDVIREMKNF